MAEIRAHMAAVVFQVHVEPGIRIEEGEEVVVLESMKMEMAITAPSSGRVTEVRVKPGDVVRENDVLVIFAS